MSIAHRHTTRALLLITLLAGLTLSVVAMAWQTPLVRDQIVADD
ncbi:hypothetical protein [Caulobacter sp. S45]|nr:hypothetical protein [Caulobacter sp. S45]